MLFFHMRLSGGGQLIVPSGRIIDTSRFRAQLQQVRDELGPDFWPALRQLIDEATRLADKCEDAERAAAHGMQSLRVEFETKLEQVRNELKNTTSKTKKKKKAKVLLVEKINALKELLGNVPNAAQGGILGPALSITVPVSVPYPQQLLAAIQKISDIELRGDGLSVFEALEGRLLPDVKTWDFDRNMFPSVRDADFYQQTMASLKKLVQCFPMSEGEMQRGEWKHVFRSERKRLPTWLLREKTFSYQRISQYWMAILKDLARAEGERGRSLKDMYGEDDSVTGVLYTRWGSVYHAAMKESCSVPNHVHDYLEDRDTMMSFRKGIAHPAFDGSPEHIEATRQRIARLKSSDPAHIVPTYNMPLFNQSSEREAMEVVECMLKCHESLS